MSDLINRQDAIEYFMTNTNWHDEDGYTIEDSEEKRKLITDYFDGVPPAERKRGEWIERSITHDRRDAKIPEWQSAKCSVCGKYHTTPYMYYFTNYDYCPNCGSEMRGDKDER